MKKVMMSIDIGTDSVKYVVGECFKATVNVLATNTIKTKGVRKGLITDSNLVINTIKDGLKEIYDNLGIEIKKVIVNVPTYNAHFLYVNDIIDVSSEDKIINSYDVNEVIRKSINNKLEQEYELVTVVPLTFILDNKKNVATPIGIKSNTLEVKGIMISVPKKNIYSVLSVMENAGLEVSDITISGLADYYEVRNPDLDKKIGAVINLGHDVTTVSIINKGKLMNTEMIQIGGRAVEKDIASLFGVSIFDARVIKEKFASCHKRFTSLNDTYEVKSTANETMKLSQIEVSEVAMERMLEILDYAKKQILLLTNQNINYIVFTGGLTEFKSFKYLSYEVFGKDVIIYSEQTLGVRNNKYITALGMIKYLDNKLTIRGKEFSMIDEEQELDLITPRSKRKRIDKGNIGKIFGNLLSNREEKK